MAGILEFHKIESEDLIRKSADLVYREYLKDGYFEPISEKEDVPISKHKLISTSKNFIAKKNGAIIGSVTVVVDNEEYGLPMDELYLDELSCYREENKNIAEVSQLAISRDLGSFLNTDRRILQSVILTSLMRCVFYYAKHFNIDMLSISINPKHYNFYKHLGFIEIGGQKNYSFVGGAPAIAKAIFLDKDFEERAVSNLVLREIIKNPLEKDLFNQKGDNIIFQVEV